MDKYKIGIKLMNCFPQSFINYQGEFIAHRYANEYFILDNCETETDVKFKILAYFSRGAYKSEPYRTKKKNDELHEFMLNGINKFLGTDFTREDMEIIILISEMVVIRINAMNLSIAIMIWQLWKV